MPHSFLYLNGLAVPRVIALTESLELRPGLGISSDFAPGLATCAEDAAIYMLTLPRIVSELKISAHDQENLARAVWNAGWDAMLLGAIFVCPIDWPIESECSSIDFVPGCSLRVVHYSLHGWRQKPCEISEGDCEWLEAHFLTAQNLIQSEVFQSSVHCLASFHWHPHPRPRLALIWAGIEALFGVDSELSFRLSLMIAKFLEPNDKASTRALFKQVKDLYRARSKAVHGGELKGDPSKLISESAVLLQRILRRCIEIKAIPNADDLTF